MCQWAVSARPGQAAYHRMHAFAETIDLIDRFHAAAVQSQHA
jgi:hypothetical protein